MREFKFRAWNKKANCFYTEDHVKAHLFGFLSKGDDPVMQFTGLLDKNRKEIYEGDIVKFAVKKKICPDCAKKEHTSNLEYGISKFCPSCGKQLSDTDFITISEVVFDKGGFAYKWNNSASYYQSWQTHVAEIYLAWVEIIGNIYENPELINQSQTKQ